MEVCYRRSAEVTFWGTFKGQVDLPRGNIEEGHLGEKSCIFPLLHLLSQEILFKEIQRMPPSSSCRVQVPFRSSFLYPELLSLYLPLPSHPGSSTPHHSVLKVTKRKQEETNNVSLPHQPSPPLLPTASVPQPSSPLWFFQNT